MSVKSAKLKKKADQWIFDYDVPIEYNYKIDKPKDNALADHDSALKWATPFINSSVPNTEIKEVLNHCFENLHVDVSDLNEMDENIEMVVSWEDGDDNVGYEPSSLTERAGMQQLENIEKDLNKDIDHSDAMNTVLRTLYSEVITAIRDGRMDEDVMEQIKELRRAVESKAKVEGEMVENETNVHLGDVVDIEDVVQQEQGELDNAEA